MPFAFQRGVYARILPCVLAVTAIVVGCSTSADSTPPASSSCADDASGPDCVDHQADATPSDGTKPTTDSGSDAAPADAAPAKDGSAPPEASACGDTTSDPSNCGTCGHGCLGASCVKGQCSPATVATVNQAFAVAVRGTDLVVIDRSPQSSDKLTVMKGNAAPGSSLTDVAGPALFTSDLTGKIRIGGGFLYYLAKYGDYGGTLYRRSLTGTTESVDETVAEYVYDFAADDEDVVYTVDDLVTGVTGTFVRPHAGAAVVVPTSTSDPARTSPYEYIALDGNAVYGLPGDDVRMIPKDGSASSPAGSVAISSGSQVAFVATPGAFVGLDVHAQNPVTCETTTYDLWTLTRPAGTKSTVLSGSGYLYLRVGDTGGYAYTLRPCNGVNPEIFSVRGTAAPASVGSLWSTDAPWTADGDYVYYEQSPGKIVRVPR